MKWAGAGEWLKILWFHTAKQTGRKGQRNQVWVQYSHFYTVQNRNWEIWYQVFVSWESATLMTERYILWIWIRHNRFVYYWNIKKLNEEWDCEKESKPNIRLLFVPCLAKNNSFTCIFLVLFQRNICTVNLCNVSHDYLNEQWKSCAW